MLSSVDTVGCPGPVVPPIHTTEGRYTSGSDTCGSDTLGWKLQRKRRGKRLAPVILPLRGSATPLVLSPDMAEARKITLWTTSIPPVKQIWERLGKNVPRGLFSTILKVRVYGMKLTRRIEIFASSEETRNLLFEHLREHPLGLSKELCRLGRDSKTRVADRSKRLESRPVDESPSRTHNPFSPLSDLAEEKMPLKFGFLNANGISPLFSYLFEGVKEKPAILGVVETYRGAGCGLRPPFGYHYLEKPIRQGTSRGVKVDEDSHGVGFLVKSELFRVIRPLAGTVKYADCYWIQLPLGSELNKSVAYEGVQLNRRLRVAREIWIGVYYLAPRLSDSALRECLLEMESIISRAGDSDAECVIMGDLNCCLRLPEDPLRSFTHGPNLSLREQLIVELLERHGLCSLHEKRPGEHLRTFCRKGYGSTMPDYILVDKTKMAQWRKPYVHANLDLDSDHWLLSSSRRDVFESAHTAEMERHTSKSSNLGTPNTHPGWKIRSLRVSTGDASQESRSTQLRAEIRARLIEKNVIGTPPRSGDEAPGTGGVSPLIPESYESWVNAVEETLDSVLGKNNPRRRRKVPFWLTGEVWEALVERRACYSALRAAAPGNSNADDLCAEAPGNNSNTDKVAELWNRFQESKRNCLEITRRVRRQQWLSFLEEINSTPKGSREMWNLVKRSRGSAGSSRWEVIKDTDGRLIDSSSPRFLGRWEEFYRGLGSARSVQDSPKGNLVEQFVSAATFGAEPVLPSRHQIVLNAPLTLSEVAKALEGLPHHKAIGADGFSNEILKAMGPEAIFGVFTKLWNEEISPESWSLSIIHPLKKAGDQTDLSNSRGISLLSCVSKLFERVLNRRLTIFLDETKFVAPEQGGFRAGHECIEHSVVLYEVLRRRNAAKVDTYVGFIDFAKAFDTVWRNGLLYKLDQAGVKGKFLRVIRALYQNTSASVRVDGSYTNKFDVSLGVRQGGVLSPLLFVVFINDLVSALRDANLGVQVPGFERDDIFSLPQKLPGLLWADDVVILADSPEQLQAAFVVVESWCKTWLMEVNASKCNVMAVGPVLESATNKLNRWVANHGNYSLGGGSVLPTTSYKYLGTLFRNDLAWKDAAAARVKAVNRTVHAHSRVLRNSGISLAIRRLYYESVVVSAGLYGSELWAHDLVECGRLDQALKPGLCMLLGGAGQAKVDALNWELGLPPAHIRAVTMRLRLLLKWKKNELCSKWARRVHLSSANLTGPSHSWHRQTIETSHRWLGLSDVNLRRPTVRCDLDLSKLISDCSLRHFRKISAGQSSSKTFKSLTKLHAEDTILSIAPYLTAGASTQKSRVMTMLRTGAIFLNNRVSKFTPERPAHCQACNTLDLETIRHFLADCPSLESERRQLGTILEGLWKCSGRRLNEWELFEIAALGESPQLLNAPQEEALLQLARVEIIHQMWRKRCALQAINSDRLGGTPRVESS